MEMYYLVIAMWTYSAVIIPEKYPLEQCEAAGKKANTGSGYRCVLAPVNTKICRSISEGPISRMVCE